MVHHPHGGIALGFDRLLCCSVTLIPFARWFLFPRQRVPCASWLTRPQKWTKSNCPSWALNSVSESPVLAHSPLPLYCSQNSGLKTFYYPLIPYFEFSLYTSIKNAEDNANLFVLDFIQGWKTQKKRGQPGGQPLMISFLKSVQRAQLFIIQRLFLTCFLELPLPSFWSSA